MIKEVREVTEKEFDINNVADQPAENVTETAEPTAEAIAETIADINTGSAAVAAAPAKAAKPKKSKKDDYRVSNFDIIKNYHRYTAKEKKHYRYIFWHRIAGYVWPFFRAVIIFGLSFVILYPILYMISTSIRPQSEMNDPSIMWIPKTIRMENFVEVWKAMNYPGTLWTTLVLNIVSSILQVGTCALTGYGFARFKFKGKNFFFALVLLQIIVPVQIILIPQYSQFRYFDIFGLFNALMGDSINLAGQGGGYHVMIYIGTLRDFGFTAEQVGEQLAPYLDNPLTIHCGMNNYHTAWYTQYLKDENLTSVTPPDGGVTISILGIPYDSVPNTETMWKGTSNVKTFYWFDLLGYNLTVINPDSEAFRWYSVYRNTEK